MSARQLRDDVQRAAAKAEAGRIAGIESIADPSDGTFRMTYRHPTMSRPVLFEAHTSGDYPVSHTFMLFSADDGAPKPVIDTLDSLQNLLVGMSAYEMALELSQQLEKAFDSRNSGDSAEPQDISDSDFSAGEDDSDYGYEFGLGEPAPAPTKILQKRHGPWEEACRRFRTDMRQVKAAGFRLGFPSDMGRDTDRGIVSISIHVSKLSLSVETLEAWDLDESEYFVLLLRFQDQYQPLYQILESLPSQGSISFRVGKCKKQKPSQSEAAAAFGISARSNEKDTGFRRLFISASLEAFMNEGFLLLLRIRHTYGCSWETANENLYDHMQRQGPKPDENFSDIMDIDLPPEHHRLLACDHLTDSTFSAEDRSFPLVAMQFAVRYFIRCTEYCLRCHRKVNLEFEALRPYVCSQELCLFQYLSMGFGPSIEHEITTQPFVVDLLVSLCYAAVQGSTPGDKGSLPIRTLPQGLGLMVPGLFGESYPTYQALYEANSRLVFQDEEIFKKFERMNEGRWIAFWRDSEPVRHATITEVDTYSKTIHIDIKAESWYPNSSFVGENNGPVQQTGLVHPSVVSVYIYDTDFDEIENEMKGLAIRHILDTLPPILDIEAYLNTHAHGTIRSMGRVSKAAESLLQWIVSSNRSCLYQIDQTLERTNADGVQETIKVGSGKSRDHERIPMMEGYMQFKFAQGSPDKELRFKRALLELATQNPGIKQHPTIFAWHGSGLHNWHSIVRTGLDFSKISCGRAFGNGVYFSPHLQTSLSYCAMHTVANSRWRNSLLQINSCISLNEIINAPDGFVSRSPHYVVDRLDWHQCRYLFVSTQQGRQAGLMQRKTTPGTGAQSQTSNSWFHPQAPGLQILGLNGNPLEIPLSAIPVRRVESEPMMHPTLQKRELTADYDESSDEEDVTFLYDDEPGNSVDRPMKRTNREDYTGSFQGLPRGANKPHSPTTKDSGATDFKPGTLDWSSLPQLGPPAFSNLKSTQLLSRELLKVQELQFKTPLHELGWYMDMERVTNLYQWILEFHSFDPSLPLAQDMKRIGITSIVLEVRFPGDFPISPPFVRVVRPRFLPFLSGGGGHVTAGGAVCMELLTNSGWSPVMSMESVLLQVRLAMCSCEPKPARLQSSGLGYNISSGVSMNAHDIYGVQEAIEAYLRAARTHGWAVPAEFAKTANGV